MNGFVVLLVPHGVMHVGYREGLLLDWRDETILEWESNPHPFVVIPYNETEE